MTPCHPAKILQTIHKVSRHTRPKQILERRRMLKHFAHSLQHAASSLTLPSGLSTLNRKLSIMSLLSKNSAASTTCRLPSGFEMPVLGFGVYQTPSDVTQEVVLHALKHGYRHIDGALAYRNEKPCADAIRASGLKREDVFFTSKVPPKSMGYEATKQAIETSFKETGLDYIDLYLVHCPFGGTEARAGTWRALVEAQQAGRIRSLGVSNYGVHHLNELEAYIKMLDGVSPGSGGKISVGQWELHPWCDRSEIVAWCRERGVAVQAFCPLVRNQRSDEPILKNLMEKYGRSAAQILVRWSIQMDFVPLPKSQTKERIVENFDVFSWELDQADVEKLRTRKYEPCAWDPTISGIDN